MVLLLRKFKGISVLFCNSWAKLCRDNLIPNQKVGRGSMIRSQKIAHCRALVGQMYPTGLEGTQNSLFLSATFDHSW